jgi:hypothetical protein
MTHDQNVLRVRKEMMPKIEAYQKTITTEKPFGCKEKLQKVVNAYDECKKVLNGYGFLVCLNFRHHFLAYS